MRTETAKTCGAQQPSRHLTPRLLSAAVLIAVATLIVHPFTSQAEPTPRARTTVHRTIDAADLVRDDRTGRTAAPLQQVPGRTRPVVVLYGDSLAWESRAYFVWDLVAAGADVETRTYGGTAICDFLDQMRADASGLKPDAVVIEFSGNALTPCVRSAAAGQGGLDLVDTYRADAETVMSIFPAARIYFAGSPVSEKASEDGEVHGAMDGLYREIAAHEANVRYVDAGAAVLDDCRWTETLSCLPGEPCAGGTDPLGRSVNVVRAPDGVHFCPAAKDAQRGVTATCPVWSSGAYRYGSAMAQPVVLDLTTDRQS